MSVTAARGFVASGVASGIKREGLDLALVAATVRPVQAAGVFTRNSAAAAPVLLSRRRLRAETAQAVVLNSGCANAGTGEEGIEDAERITKRTASLLAIDPDHVLMCSTGPIGTRLPVDSMVASLPALVSDATIDGTAAAAEAILTTDTKPKTVVIEHGGFTLGGIAKGAAMLRPDMATMLCVLTTDARASSAALQHALSEAVVSTFNALNIDGCESTNDTVLLLSSGLGPKASDKEMVDVVTEACRQLARQMAADAEGATKVVTLRIGGAIDDDAARRFGRVVADSGLVRSSFFGGDPNWGRILAALGTCRVNPAEVSIAYEGFGVAERGVALPFDESKVADLLAGDFVVDIIVGDGAGRAEIVTTDLTPEYVRFNGERS